MGVGLGKLVRVLVQNLTEIGTKYLFKISLKKALQRFLAHFSHTKPGVHLVNCQVGAKVDGYKVWGGGGHH